MLNEIKKLLGLTGIEEEELDAKLYAIIDIVEARLKNLIDSDTIPCELRYIVIEVCVSRFNRIGSEGMESHDVDGENTHYINDDFAPYMDEIKAYSNKNNNKWTVRFL